nr:hypothetical protein [Tanacetum cinerariifolium]
AVDQRHGTTGDIGREDFRDDGKEGAVRRVHARAGDHQQRVGPPEVLEILRRQQQHARGAEGFGVVLHRLDAHLLGIKARLQFGLFFSGQPLGLGRTLVHQTPPDKRPDHRRQTFDDEHPAPAEVRHQVARDHRHPQHGHRVTEDQHGVGPRALGLGKPIAEVHQHGRHHRRLDHAEHEANADEHVGVGHDARQRSQAAPQDQADEDQLFNALFLRVDCAGHLEKEVGQAVGDENDGHDQQPAAFKAGVFDGFEQLFHFRLPEHVVFVAAGALGTEFDDHCFCAQIQVKPRDVARCVESGQQLAFRHPGHDPVRMAGEPVDLPDHRALARPQRRAKVGVERHAAARFAHLRHQHMGQLSAGVRQGRRNASGVQMSGFEQLGDDVVDRQMTGGRTASEILDYRVGAFQLQRFELKPGRASPVHRDMGAVDAFL